LAETLAEKVLRVELREDALEMCVHVWRPWRQLNGLIPSSQGSQRTDGLNLESRSISKCSLAVVNTRMTDLTTFELTRRPKNGLA
jgi:hypothetical protein